MHLRVNAYGILDGIKFVSGRAAAAAKYGVKKAQGDLLIQSSFFPLSFFPSYIFSYFFRFI